MFGNENNDPRLKGVSSFKKNNITQVNKVFLQVAKRLMVVHHGVFKLIK